MKHAGKILICLAAALALNASLRADDAAVASNDSPVVLPGNPYAPIVARNVFSLVPIPVVDPNATPPETPLKISPNGIMSIFGNLQVLFKVTGAPGGKEDSYILMEGQRQDDIEVVKIDEKNNLVTFNNHGVVQTIPLANAPASGGASPALGGNSGTPAFNPNNGNGNNGNNGGGFGRFGNRGGFGRARGGQNAPGGDNFNGNGNGASDGGDNLNLRSVPTRSYQPPQTGLSPEENTAAIIINTEQMKESHDPAYIIMPPPPGP